MKVLEEFWYVNIAPVERPFQCQRKFDKVFRLLTKNEEELLEKYKACYDEMIQTTECQTFIKGFKLGARFFMECFENDEIMKKKIICTALVPMMLLTQTASDGGSFIRPITQRYGESISLENYVPIHIQGMVHRSENKAESGNNSQIYKA